MRSKPYYSPEGGPGGKMETTTTASGGTSTTTDNKKYVWEPAKFQIPQTDISAIPWAAQYDLGDAFNKWLAAHGDSVTGTPRSREWFDSAWQKFKTEATPNWAATAGVKAAPSATYNMEQYGGLNRNPGYIGQEYKAFDENGRFVGHQLVDLLKAHRDGTANADTPEAQNLSRALKENFPGKTEQEAARLALRDINAKRLGGNLTPALQGLTGMAYNTAALTDAQNRINGLNTPNTKPAEPTLPQTDMGLATQIGNVQQQANIGLSPIERRQLENQNARNFAGAAGRIQQTGDSSNIGANMAALYANQQNAGTQQALASEQVRGTNQDRLSNLLAQQRAQANTIAAANMNLYGMRNQQYQMNEAARRGDLNAAQYQRWGALSDMANGIGNMAGQYFGNRPYTYGTWGSNQAKRIEDENLALAYPNGQAGKAATPIPAGILPMGGGVYSPQYQQQYMQPAPAPPYPGGPYAAGYHAPAAPTPQGQFNLMQGPGQYYGTQHAPMQPGPNEEELRQRMRETGFTPQY